ncbi:MAG: 2-C-methyl-D-erythritol 2,4-cyclodiphosphate synthase [Vulcanimicrobiota bacterium]
MTETEVLELIRRETRYRTGVGYDVHRCVEGRRCVLGGVDIPWEKGLQGHSDADVLVHAAMDAVLGAAGLADIGTYFPDTDDKFKGVDSLELAREVARLLASHGFELCNLDVMVMAEAPRLKPHIPAMKTRVAEAFGLRPDQLGIKATTNEKLGFLGRQEGIAAVASALVRQVWPAGGSG